MASNYYDLKQTSNSNSSCVLQLKAISNTGPKVHGHVACVVDGVMYAHGGLVNKNDRIPSNALFRFHTEGNIWQDITPANSPYLSHHCAVVQDRCILLIGGWNGGGRTSDVFVYDTASGTCTLAVSKGFPNGAGLSNHTCTLLKDGRILVFGREGSLKTQRKYGNAFILEGNVNTMRYSYSDLEINTASRSGHSAIEIDNKHLMIIGGRKDKLFEIHAFSLLASGLNETTNVGAIVEASISKPLGKDPGGRRGAACIKITKSLCLIHGGETFDSHFRNPVDDILVFNFETHKWYQLGKTSVCLQMHSVCNLNGRCIIHGGLTNANQTSNVTYEILQSSS